eukprot:31062-Pelagococcus_subviridis.AAC.5
MTWRRRERRRVGISETVRRAARPSPPSSLKCPVYPAPRARVGVDAAVLPSAAAAAVVVAPVVLLRARGSAVLRGGAERTIHPALAAVRPGGDRAEPEPGRARPGFDFHRRRVRAPHEDVTVCAAGVHFPRVRVHGDRGRGGEVAFQERERSRPTTATTRTVAVKSTHSTAAASAAASRGRGSPTSTRGRAAAAALVVVVVAAAAAAAAAVDVEHEHVAVARRMIRALPVRGHAQRRRLLRVVRALPEVSLDSQTGREVPEVYSIIRARREQVQAVGGARDRGDPARVRAAGSRSRGNGARRRDAAIPAASVY